MLKEKIEIFSDDPDKILDKLEIKFSDAQADRTDGLKLCWDNSWVHIRKSNTEPIIRIYAEASTDQQVNKIIQGVKRVL